VFYYADEFNISWHPTIRALWSPRGQQVMIPTPKQPTRRYGLGAANWHTGETVVLVRRRKRRREIAELLQALVDKHPHERVYVAWDNSGTHQDAEVEAVLRAAAGRLVLLYLPTYSPWLNPIEMLWRQWRARSPTASCSPACRRCSPRRRTSSTAYTDGRAGCAPSSAHSPRDLRRWT
jgi:putative transposase